MPAYRPFWCEENIWQLADDPVVGPGERHALFITATGGRVACWRQRAGGADGLVLWDYHVVLAVRHGGWRVWDLDTELGCPLPATRWLAGTFPCPDQVRPAFQPRFHLVPGRDYRRDFATDRRHMRRADGGWQQPPPPWPAPAGQGTTLASYLDRARNGLDLAGLEAHLSWDPAPPMG